MTNQELYNKIVILGLYYTGYGIIRELRQHNIPIYIFDKIVKWPESVTKLATIINHETEEELLNQLIDFSQKQENKPVMYLASDYYVDFYKRNKQTLEKKYLIDFPENDIVENFLDKGLFSTFARENGFVIPQTVIVNSYSDYEQQSSQLIYPCIVKPFWRTDNWLKAGLKKVYLFNSKKECDEGINQIMQFETSLIIQEFIPGGDDEVYFHLMYYNNKPQCIGELTGRKLRQWPVGLGQAACAEPAPDEIEVKNKSRELFNFVKYRGFGSVEYRRNPLNGKFYITEPTVGRQDSQSLLAPANGVYLAYTEQTGIALKVPVKPGKKVYRIDDQYDVFSIISSIPKGQFKLKHIVKSYFGKKIFRLCNIKDPGVAIYCWTIVILDKIFSKLAK